MRDTHIENQYDPDIGTGKFRTFTICASDSPQDVQFPDRLAIDVPDMCTRELDLDPTRTPRRVDVREASGLRARWGQPTRSDRAAPLLAHGPNEPPWGSAAGVRPASHPGMALSMAHAVPYAVHARVSDHRPRHRPAATLTGAVTDRG